MDTPLLQSTLKQSQPNALRFMRISDTYTFFTISSNIKSKPIRSLPAIPSMRSFSTTRSITVLSINIQFTSLIRSFLPSLRRCLRNSHISEYLICSWIMLMLLWSCIHSGLVFPCHRLSSITRPIMFRSVNINRMILFHSPKLYVFTLDSVQQP